MITQEVQAAEREPIEYEQSLIEQMLRHTSQLEQMDRVISQCRDEIGIRRRKLGSLRETRRVYVTRIEEVRRKLAEENRLLRGRKQST